MKEKYGIKITESNLKILKLEIEKKNIYYVSSYFAFLHKIHMDKKFLLNKKKEHINDKKFEYFKIVLPLGIKREMEIEAKEIGVEVGDYITMLIQTYSDEMESNEEMFIYYFRVRKDFLKELNTASELNGMNNNDYIMYIHKHLKLKENVTLNALDRTLKKESKTNVKLPLVIKKEMETEAKEIGVSLGDYIIMINKCYIDLNISD